MKRAATVILAVLIFAAASACGVLWILSLNKEQVLMTNMADGDWLTADHGALVYQNLFHRNGFGFNHMWGTNTTQVSARFFGFEWDRSFGGNTVLIPLWFPVLLFGATGIVVLFQNTRKEFARGMCRECGYDLRASKDRCPECGTPRVEQTAFDI